ncbi:MAG: O-antigen ligase family protein, partial [Acidobacteriota bacterium]
MAYYGLLVYIVLLIIRPGDWVPWVLGWPLELVVAGTTWAVALLKTRDNRGQPGSAFYMLIAGWVTAVFLSDLLNGLFDLAIDRTIICFKLSMVLVLFWLVVDSINKLRGVATMLAVLAGVLGLQGIYMIQHGVGWAGQDMYWGGRIRWVGLWDGANVLSLVFVTAFPFILELFFGRWGLSGKLIAVASGALTLTGLYLANSRGGYLALAVTMLVFFRHRIGWKGVIIAALLIAVVFSVGPSRLAELEGSDKSARNRVDMWAEGLEMLKYNPVFGIGKGEFGSYTGTLIAHNTFIETMGETGFVGLFFYIGLIYVAFKCLFHVLRVSEKLSPRLVSLTQALLASLIAYLSASMFISTDFEPIYLLMGLSAAVFRMASQAQGVRLSFEFGLIDVAAVGARVDGAGGQLIYENVTSYENAFRKHH